VTRNDFLEGALMRITLRILVLLAVAVPAVAVEVSDDAAIRRTVETYLHGLKFNDVASLASAFHPDARLFFVKKDGSLEIYVSERKK
jgi:hypothetical protein